MKKRIFAFVAVLVLTFGVLFVSAPKKAHADETQNTQSLLVYAFDYPYYFTDSNSAYVYSLVNNIRLFLSDNTLTVQMLSRTNNDLINPIYGYKDVLFYQGLPSNNSSILTIRPVFFEVYRGSSVNPRFSSPVSFKISYSFSGSMSVVSFINDLDYITTSYDLSSKSFYIDIYFVNGTYGMISLVLDSSDLISTYYPFYLLTEYSSIVYNVNDSLYTIGYDRGKADGYSQGKSEGESIGYQRGFGEAEELYRSIGEISFFSLISSVVDVPVKAFTNLFNFEILGINLFDFMSGLLTLALVLTIFRIIFR